MAPSHKGSNKNKATRSSKDESPHTTTTVCLTIYCFRGEPDHYFNRHVLLYFTSPDNSHFHETVHAQCLDAEVGWRVARIHHALDWALTTRYLGHVNAGAVPVPRGQEMGPVDTVAATPVAGRAPEWNCQHFLLEGLQSLVYAGYFTQEWYAAVEEELMEALLFDSLP